MVFRSLDAVDFTLEDCAPLPTARHVVLTTPTHFDVTYIINPHMVEHVGGVDTAVAWQQWKALRAVYQALDCTVHVVSGQPDLPDMVFCANQTLPYQHPGTGDVGVVLSRMHTEERQPEVQHFARFFRARGYTVNELPADVASDFEGMGDAIWHTGRHLLWGGYGYRTDLDAYEALSEMLDVPIVTVHLDDPDFYHLDTCFSVLREDTVLLYPGVFSDDERALIGHFFETVIEAPEGEARDRFACNAHCPDGTHVIIHEGCSETSARLAAEGFVPVDVDTGEFLKAGGSVFCMKLMTWLPPDGAL